MADGERGSVLVLMPVAVLIFVVLGALAVDATVLFLGERELAGAAAGAANDAATRAIDRESFYARGVVVLDPHLAVEVATTSVAAKRLGANGYEVETPEVVVDGDRVTVTVRGRAPHLFGRALAGMGASTPVSATATATAASP